MKIIFKKKWKALIVGLRKLIAFIIRGTALLTVLLEKPLELNSESANKLVCSSFPANPEDDLISRSQTSIHFELSSLTTNILNSKQMLQTNLRLLPGLHAFLLVRVSRPFPNTNTTLLKLICFQRSNICLIPILKNKLLQLTENWQ